MASEGDNLDGELIGLLYLSDELAPEQRARFEAALQRDTALRQQLDELRAAQGVVSDLLSRADAARPLAISEAAASRKVARAIAQWRIDWLAKPRTASHSSRFRLRTLVPAAVAAGLLLGSIMYFWWSWSQRPEPSLVQSTTTTSDPDDTSIADNQNEDDATRTAAIAGALAMHTPDDSELTNVEQQLSALNYLAESIREEGVSR